MSGRNSNRIRVLSLFPDDERILRLVSFFFFVRLLVIIRLIGGLEWAWESERNSVADLNSSVSNGSIWHTAHTCNIEFRIANLKERKKKKKWLLFSCLDSPSTRWTPYILTSFLIHAVTLPPSTFRRPNNNNKMNMLWVCNLLSLVSVPLRSSPGRNEIRVSISHHQRQRQSKKWKKKKMERLLRNINIYVVNYVCM